MSIHVQSIPSTTGIFWRLPCTGGRTSPSELLVVQALQAGEGPKRAHADVARPRKLGPGVFVLRLSRLGRGGVRHWKKLHRQTPWNNLWRLQATQICRRIIDFPFLPSMFHDDEHSYPEALHSIKNMFPALQVDT